MANLGINWLKGRKYQSKVITRQLLPIEQRRQHCIEATQMFACSLEPGNVTELRRQETDGASRGLEPNPTAGTVVSDHHSVKPLTLPELKLSCLAECIF